MELLDRLNENELCVLHRASVKNDVVAPTIFIDFVDDKWKYINFPRTFIKESALFRAVLTGSTEIVKLLLDTAQKKLVNIS